MVMALALSILSCRSIDLLDAGKIVSFAGTWLGI